MPQPPPPPPLPPGFVIDLNGVPVPGPALLLQQAPPLPGPAPPVFIDMHGNPVPPFSLQGLMAMQMPPAGDFGPLPIPQLGGTDIHKQISTLMVGK